MNFKLVYEKDGMIKGSEQTIPTTNDKDIISREALDEYKLVYSVNGEIRGAKESAIPSAEDDVIYSAEAEEGEEEVEEEVEKDEPILVPEGSDETTGPSYDLPEMSEEEEE